MSNKKPAATHNNNSKTTFILTNTKSMIKNLPKKINTNLKKYSSKTRSKQILSDLSKDLLQPREEAINAILAKAAKLKLA